MKKITENLVLGMRNDIKNLLKNKNAIELYMNDKVGVALVTCNNDIEKFIPMNSECVFVETNYLKDGHKDVNCSNDYPLHIANGELNVVIGTTMFELIEQDLNQNEYKQFIDKLRENSVCYRWL